MDLYKFVRPALFQTGPEEAHRLAIAALKLGFAPQSREADPSAMSQRVCGLDFPNPIGMAAGFDKDAEVPDALLALGFGFVEVGTVTPKPQAGNPRPRVFRLTADKALINRLGFNSAGHDAAKARLEARQGYGIVGVNIGANKESTDRTADYVAGLEAFHDLADYLTVNISSPNTPGLRDLQAKGALGELLDGLIAARAGMNAVGARPVPLLVKIAPDLDEGALEAIVETAIDKGIDGLIVSNTTITREGLSETALAAEAGGLSGRPLFELSTRILARAYTLTQGRIALIGVGGVASGDDVLTKLKAGASLVQLYTAMVFEGPGLVQRIKRELRQKIKDEGFAGVGEAVGVDAEKLMGLGLNPPQPLTQTPAQDYPDSAAPA